MAAHACAVLDDLLSALRANHAGYDLRTTLSTPRVVVGDGGSPPVGPPYVIIAPPRPKSLIDRGAPLTEYHVSGEFEWGAFAGAAAETTESRARAALDIANDLATALQNAHHSAVYSTLYALTILEVEVLDILSDGPDLPAGLGIAYGIIRYETHRSRGI